MKLFSDELKSLKKALNDVSDDKVEKHITVIQDLNNYIDDSEKDLVMRIRRGG